LGTEYETLGADNLATELSLPDLNWNGIGRWNWRQITKKLYLGLKWFVPVEQVEKVDFGLARLVQCWLKTFLLGWFVDCNVRRLTRVAWQTKALTSGFAVLVNQYDAAGGEGQNKNNLRFELHNLVNLQKRRILRRRLVHTHKATSLYLSDRMKSVAYEWKNKDADYAAAAHCSDGGGQQLVTCRNQQTTLAFFRLSAFISSGTTGGQC
jgi:hypothetical protein